MKGGLPLRTPRLTLNVVEGGAPNMTSRDDMEGALQA